MFRFLLCFMTALAAMPAIAFNINIVPNSYTGTYEVVGDELGIVSGNQTFTLAQGTHNLKIAPGVSFNFDVDSSGNVTNISTAAAASASGSTLTFNNTTITIDPDDYTGAYSMRGVNTTKTSGIRNFILLPGISSYIVDIANGVSFKIDVNGSGVVSSQDADHASGSGSTLTFNTVTITINPGEYTGVYYLDEVNETSASGQRNFIVIPDLESYIVVISAGVSFRFDVNADGTVDYATIHSYPNTYTVSGSTLTFVTDDIEVDPADDTVNYRITGVNNTYAAGGRTFKVVRDIGASYQFQANVGGTVYSGTFAVNYPCSIPTSMPLTLGGKHFTVACNILSCS